MVRSTNAGEVDQCRTFFSYRQSLQRMSSKQSKSDADSNAPTEKSRTGWGWKRTGCLTVLLILLIVAGIGYFFANDFAKSKISNQLSQLGLGDADVGSVAIMPDGISASDISFPETNGVSLSVDSLRIYHPISGLIAGDESFNSIEIGKPSVVLDASQLGGGETEFDLASLSDLSLPTNDLTVTDANVKLVDGNREANIDGIDVKITDKDGVLKLDGSTGDLLGAQWQIDGQFNREQAKATVKLTADEGRVLSDELVNLPMIPQSISDSIKKNVSFEVAYADTEVNVVAEGKKAPQLSVQSKVDKSNLKLLAFDLPITINSADVDLQDTDIELTNISATTCDESAISGNDCDLITGKSQISFGDDPITIDFQTGFEQFNTATLRKIVTALPAEVTGTADGTANGKVLINLDGSVAIAIDADAKTGNGSYGKLLAENADIDVQIESLRFDENINYESIAGAVQVTGNAKQQPIASLLDTFDLAALNQQLELTADYDAKFDLKLPLETVEDLATWELSAVAQAPTATLSTAKLSNIDIETSLRGGNLEVSKLTAIAEPDGVEKAPAALQNINSIDGYLSWPIVVKDNLPTTGKIKVAGQGVALNWLLQLGQRQLEIINADSDTATETASSFDVSDLTDQNISGQVNFDVDWDIPVATPDNLESWVIAGKVDQSTINVDQESLNNLTATFGLRDGQFDVSSTEGKFSSGGRISEGSVSYDVGDGKLDSAAVTTRNVPLSWLIKLGIQNVPAASDWAKTNPEIAEELQSLDGKLSVSIETDEQNPQDNFQIKAVSSGIVYKDLQVADILVDTNISNNKIEINNAEASLAALPDPEQLSPEVPATIGSLKASGQWSLTDDPSGQIKLVARQLPLELLSEVTDVGAIPSGIVGGTFLVSQQPQPGTTFPVSIKGLVKTRELAMAMYRLRPLDFEVATNEKGLTLNSKPSKLMAGMKLTANVGDNFEQLNANLKLDRFSLQSLFDDTSILDDDQEMVTVSGVAVGEANFQLSLKTNQWNSTGDLAVAQPILNELPLTDLTAKWEHSPTDFENSVLKVNLFGGEFDLVKLSADATKADFKLKDVDLAQLARIVPQKTRASGLLSGTLAIDSNANIPIADRANPDDASNEDSPKKGGLSVVVKLVGQEVAIEQLVLGQAKADINLSGDSLSYTAESQLIDGKLAATGKTTLSFLLGNGSEPEPEDRAKNRKVKALLSNETKNRFDEPVISKSATVTLTQGSLGAAIKQFADAKQLRQIEGKVTAKIEIGLNPEGELLALGDVNIGDVRYQNRVLTKQVSTRVKVEKGVMQLDQLQVDLVQGKIGGLVRVPLDLSRQGSFQLNISQLDLSRINELILRDKRTGLGLVNGRISGTVGSTISGVATLDVSRSKLLGAKSSQLRLPVRFLVRTESGSGQIELSRTRQQILGGTVAGKAKITFGNTLNLDTDIELSRIDTALLTAAFGASSPADGSLSGDLKLTGTRIQTARDLKGVFRGKLEQAQAFELPILDQLSRFSPGAQLQSNDFESEEILVRLQKGQIEIEQFNVGSSIASIAVSGKAGILDGRLDLQVIARIERFNQVSLIEQLSGSPLVNLTGTPVAFFAQAADFLSDRLLFLKVRGTIARPLIVPDSSQQLREELIRYFLRGSQILPNGANLNN